MPASRKPFPLPSAAWLRFFVRVSCATRVSSPRASCARASNWLSFLSLLSSPWPCDLPLRSLSRARSAARKVDCHEHDHAAGNLQRDERLGEQDPGEDPGPDRLTEENAAGRWPTVHRGIRNRERRNGEPKWPQVIGRTSATPASVSRAGFFC